MKKMWKRVAALALTGLLAVSSALSTFAFYQEPASKKGILISMQEPEMLEDISALGCAQAICNLASSQSVDSYDRLASYCKSHGITLTMILINPATAKDSNLLPCKPVSTAGNYQFNVRTEVGEAAVRQYAKTVAAHYADTVSNWIIGNEVNDAVTWDYSGVSDIDQHAADYAKGFRIFYEEIKKVNPDARVFIPFDMRWHAQAAGDTTRYTVADYLPKLNALLADTDYGIAWHAYPVHFDTKPEFLDDDGITDDVNTTPNINLKNLHILTDYMQQSEMLTPEGNVRHLILSEQGFTSACDNGEARQAAAIEAAWEIANSNPYVEAFLLSRQVDAASQVAAGGAFGLWTRDTSAKQDEIAKTKKQAWYTYQSLQ